jgi:predicted porin
VIERQPLSGGYVQAMYKIDNIFGTQGTVIPYVKWQTYRGSWKGSNNSPYISTDEVESGIEYQMMKALELTLAYSHMDRTNAANLGQAQGDLLRMQLQWNY